MTEDLISAREFVVLFALDRGLRNEQRFLHLITDSLEAQKLPPHIIHFKQATERFDVRGIDFFCMVRLPNGKIVQYPLQVKSSAKGQEKFLRQKRVQNIEIPIIIVNEYRTDEDILSDFERAIDNLYAAGRCFDRLHRALRVAPSQSELEGIAEGNRKRERLKQILGASYQLPRRNGVPDIEEQLLLTRDERDGMHARFEDLNIFMSTVLNTRDVTFEEADKFQQLCLTVIRESDKPAEKHWLFYRAVVITRRAHLDDSVLLELMNEFYGGFSVEQLGIPLFNQFHKQIKPRGPRPE